ncbi:SDR family oxidoreductase [Flavihumibacter solisilvae]|uniref:SDR family oxidoreductase n=1 Tax=Flavihumibacter solisilvae TaxID=1349421 RepID=UPI00068F0EE0|nr:SDR family oxidoreductase [Flavihumibacter solisilvae]
MIHIRDLSGSTFLITGGAGFIGSSIVDYLMEGNPKLVRVLDNLSTGKIGNIEAHLHKSNFEFIEGDIRDYETCQRSVRGIQYLSHQAALGSVPRSINDPLQTNDVNINGFLNMLEAARNEPSIIKMVYAASSSTYGDHPGLPKVEHQIGKPLSPYAVSKLVNELYADVFSKVYGFNTIGLRYFNVFGPKQGADNAYAAVIPLFLKAAKTGNSPTINGDGETSRDFTYISNVVNANMLALFGSGKIQGHEVVNIACGQQTTLNQLWVLICEAMKVNIEPSYGPHRKGDVLHSLANIEKAEGLLQYTPEVLVKEGVELLVKAYVGAYGDKKKNHESVNAFI